MLIFAVKWISKQLISKTILFVSKGAVGQRIHQVAVISINWEALKPLQSALEKNNATNMSKYAIKSSAILFFREIEKKLF